MDDKEKAPGERIIIIDDTAKVIAEFIEEARIAKQN